jgi:hypothetical protein
MSKHRKTKIASSASGAKGFQKQTNVSNQTPDNTGQESTFSVAAVPTVMPTSEQGSQNVTFTAAMLHLQVEILGEIIDEGRKQIKQYISQIQALNPDIQQQVSFSNSIKIVEYINLLIHIKELVAGLLSWMSVLASICHYFIVNFEEHLTDDVISNIESFLIMIGSAFDTALTSIPSNSILGITLAPDQKQVSETKALIADILSSIEKIKQENEEASKDWGVVEQNASERILEGSNKNVSGGEFLSWLSELEQGNDV